MIRSLLTFCLFSGVVTSVEGREYWVAPEGDDHADGTSRQRAWASPSRGQPTRLSEAYTAGKTRLSVYSTHGFLQRGRITVNGETRAYQKKSAAAFELTESFTKDIAANIMVFDAGVLGGKSFSPGDVVILCGGIFLDRPLNFCQPGAKEQPITYRSAPGERAILTSSVFDRSPIRHLGNRRSVRTKHVALENLTVRNSADGNHGAPGIDLFGVSHIVVRGCNVNISGRDINGDNNALRLFDADHVTIAGCRLRSRYANGIAAWATSEVAIVDSLIYESFHGIIAAGGRYTSHLSIRNCTVFATNQHGGIRAEPPGKIAVMNSIVGQMPSADIPAFSGNGNGDYNCVWRAAEGYGKGWNGTASGIRGQHDFSADPQFLSLNPASPHFLRFTTESPAATAGEDGTHIGAFPPIAMPPQASKTAKFNVRDFGAVGDGIHDDTDAILAAVAAAKRGGTVVFPPSSGAYLIGKTIRLNHDHIRLSGTGATLKLRAAAGRIHMIEVSGDGPAKSIVEHITVEGLTLDANYHRQPQQRSGGIPRGVWVENAHRVLLKDLTIRDAYCGMTFARNSRDCDAIGVTVTDWDHDAFGASGWGKNGGCTDIRFTRCKAVNTSRCVKAWEIEEGAQRVRLQDCLVENLGGTGTGFYVRHHEYRWPLLVDDVTFVRCRVKNISGAAFLITTVPGKPIRPYIRTRNIRLINCKADGRVTIACGVENANISGGTFGGTMGIGFESHENRPVNRGPKWPVRSVTIHDAQIQRLVINAQTGNPADKLGDRHYPNYEPQIRLTDVRTEKPVEITGKESNVIIE